MIHSGFAGHMRAFHGVDGYMRVCGLGVPGDCVASKTDEEHRHVWGQMNQVLKEDVRATTEFDLNAPPDTTLVRNRPRLNEADRRYPAESLFLSDTSQASASGELAGPEMTWPLGSKREPWQGQSQVFSAPFQCTMQPRCGQTAESSCAAPRPSR